MEGIELIATGAALPKNHVHNNDLAKIMDTSDEWIFTRTGIHSRYFCKDGESMLTLSVEAAKQALSRSGLAREEIGALVVATVTPDYVTPSAACLVQSELGLREDIPVLDINAACTGFLYGLEVARGLLASGGETYALVIGAEQLSRILNMEDRSTAVLFGDGAAAAVIRRSKEAEYAAMLGARGGKEIMAPGAGTGKPSFVEMDGKAVFRFATSALPKCVNALLEKTGSTMEDVDWVICHQANMRIIDHCIKKLKAPGEKFYMNMEHYGNTSSASVPIALNELYEAGKVKKGQKIMLVGFGSGLTWGGCLISFA